MPDENVIPVGGHASRDRAQKSACAIVIQTFQCWFLKQEKNRKSRFGVKRDFES